MSDEVGIRELNNAASSVIDRVENGEVITVTKRGKPVARIMPADLPRGIAMLLAEGRIHPPTRQFVLPDPIGLQGKGKAAAEYVSEGRR